MIGVVCSSNFLQIPGMGLPGHNRLRGTLRSIKCHEALKLLAAGFLFCLACSQAQAQKQIPDTRCSDSLRSTTVVHSILSSLGHYLAIPREFPPSDSVSMEPPHLRFRILPDGRVADARITSGTTEEEAMLDSLLYHVVRLRFPAMKTAPCTVSVIYPVTVNWEWEHRPPQKRLK